MRIAVDHTLIHTGRGMLEQTGLETHPQMAAHLVVDHLLRHPSVPDCGQQPVLEPGRMRHFHVQAVVGGLVGAVDRDPVGHHNALKSPIVLENVGDQMAVFAAMLAVDEIVGRHDRLRPRFSYGSLEDR